MKKRIFAICMAAVMLTGCGSTAAGTPDAGASGSPGSPAAAGKKDEKIDRENEQLDYNNGWTDVELPYPARLKRCPYGLTGVLATNTVTDFEGDEYDEENTVFYIFEEDFSDETEELPGLDQMLEETFIEDVSDWFYRAFDSVADEFSTYTIESKEEKEILGYKALRASGTIQTKNGPALDEDSYIVHFTSYYSIFKNAYSDKEEYLPVMWMAFTLSNDEEVLDDMNYIADLALTKAKPYER